MNSTTAPMYQTLPPNVNDVSDITGTNGTSQPYSGSIDNNSDNEPQLPTGIVNITEEPDIDNSNCRNDFRGGVCKLAVSVGDVSRTRDMVGCNGDPVKCAAS